MICFLFGVYVFFGFWPLGLPFASYQTFINAIAGRQDLIENEKTRLEFVDKVFGLWDTLITHSDKLVEAFRQRQSLSAVVHNIADILVANVRCVTSSCFLLLIFLAHFFSC